MAFSRIRLISMIFLIGQLVPPWSAWWAARTTQPLLPVAHFQHQPTRGEMQRILSGKLNRGGASCEVCYRIAIITNRQNLPLSALVKSALTCRFCTLLFEIIRKISGNDFEKQDWIKRRSLYISNGNIGLYFWVADHDRPLVPASDSYPPIDEPPMIFHLFLQNVSCRWSKLVVMNDY